MSVQLSDYLQKPFALVTERLILIPTPIAIGYSGYVHLYGSLHASESFCQMAFGPHFLARELSDQETREMILTRDLERCWKPRGLGDFAVALRVKCDGSEIVSSNTGKKLEGQENLRILDLANLSGTLSTSALDSLNLGEAEWVGYAGVRDATSTSMPDRTAEDEPLPPWQEMVELRYGVHANYWGKGLAGSAARAVMQWAASERGVRRFIAETEKTNTRSGKVLQKMGFRESDTNYWKEPNETEWEQVAS